MKILQHCNVVFFFFNDPATTEIYTLSLHDALPISPQRLEQLPVRGAAVGGLRQYDGEASPKQRIARSEEHTSELQSPCNLVCRLLLEKKKHSETTESPTHPKQELANSPYPYKPAAG